MRDKNFQAPFANQNRCAHVRTFWRKFHRRSHFERKFAQYPFAGKSAREKESMGIMLGQFPVDSSGLLVRDLLEPDNRRVGTRQKIAQLARIRESVSDVATERGESTLSGRHLLARSCSPDRFPALIKNQPESAALTSHAPFFNLTRCRNRLLRYESALLALPPERHACKYPSGTPSPWRSRSPSHQRLSESRVRSHHFASHNGSIMSSDLCGSG